MMYETDSDDNDLEDLRFIFSCQKQERSIQYIYLRVNWDEHIERLVHNNKIEQRFRMPLYAVNYLIDELREPLTSLMPRLLW